MAASLSRQLDKELELMKPWNQFLTVVPELRGPEIASNRVVAKLRYVSGLYTELEKLLVDVKIGDKAVLTTGAKSGVKVENKFGSPEHADRLMHSEFGLACLWDRRGELVTIWKLEHPTIRYHGNKHVIVIPLKKDGKGDLKVTVLKLDFKKDLDKLKLSIEHQLSHKHLPHQRPYLPRSGYSDDKLKQELKLTNTPSTSEADQSLEMSTAGHRELFYGPGGSIIIGRSAVENEFPRQYLNEAYVFTSSRLSMTAISTTTHELSIAEYERIRPEIRRIVLCGMLEHGGMYTAVDMKAIPAEPGHEVSLPTVYILFHNPQDIAHRLAGIMTQLRMEIHKGGTQFFNIAGPRNAAFEQEVTIGHSIGVKGAASSGTMGGYLYEASTGNRFGLTNGHVCGMLMKKSLESLPMIMDGEGVPVEIVQNSDQDQEGFFEDAKLAYDTAANKAAECGGLDTRRNMRELEAKKKFDIIKGQNRLFGVVVRAELGIWNSPALEEDRCWKDYGVILPIKERLGASEYRHRGDKSVHGHVPVNINMELTKAPGRTTDTMDATVNGVLSDAWMTCPLLKYDVAFETREYACIATGSSTTPLSEGGDSGSLFVEGTMHAKLSPRQVAGLLFGGGLRPKQKLNSNVPPRDMAGFEVTFMTPATRLLQWLKEDTGMDLEFGDGSWTL